MSLCVATGASVLTLVAGSFSLSWTHSVEKTEWVEHWRVEDATLALVSAHVKGPGAGIDLPSNAEWKDGGWTFTPALPPQAELNLAASGMTPSAWTLCTTDSCFDLGATAGSDVRLWVAEQC
jgi:hypothetical protein